MKQGNQQTKNKLRLSRDLKSLMSKLNMKTDPEPQTPGNGPPTTDILAAHSNSQAFH